MDQSIISRSVSCEDKNNEGKDTSINVEDAETSIYEKGLEFFMTNISIGLSLMKESGSFALRSHKTEPKSIISHNSTESINKADESSLSDSNGSYPIDWCVITLDQKFAEFEDNSNAVDDENNNIEDNEDTTFLEPQKPKQIFHKSISNSMINITFA